MADPAVLVLTRLDDPTSDEVIAELHRRGVPVVRLDPGDFLCGGIEMSVRYHDHGKLYGHLTTPSRTLDLTKVRSVYYRRPSPHEPPGNMSDDDARFAIEQARYGLNGLLASLPDCRYVNHPRQIAHAEFKAVQFAAASAVGFQIPATLITNRLDDARAFCSEFGPVVYKPLRNTPFTAMNGHPVTIWVRTVDPSDLDESITATAHLFQAVVHKVADVRTTVIGERVFSVRIESPHLDWREDYGALTYRAIPTPEHTAQACQAYLRRLGLLYGAFDFGIARDGGWWWYECNPAGQWQWLEEETGLPMTAATADLLEVST